MEEFFSKLYDTLEKFGIEPFHLFTVIMVSWVVKDILYYRKNDNWKKETGLGSANFISRCVAAILFVLASILFGTKE